MSVCVTTNYLDPRSIYPVLDPRRTAGTGPHAYGYSARVGRHRRAGGAGSVAFQLRDDGRPGPRCGRRRRSRPGTSSPTPRATASARSGSGQLLSMNVRRAWGPGNTCGTGTDTVVLCRHFAWPRGTTALYCFPPQDFWDFWGGCKVTFEWFSDTAGSGVWGSDTRLPPTRSCSSQTARSFARTSCCPVATRPSGSMWSSVVRHSGSGTGRWARWA